MVSSYGMSQPCPGSQFWNEVRGICHAFHSAGDGHVGMPESQTVMSKHDSLHSRAAHLVYGGCGDAVRQSRTDAGLTGGRLSEACSKDATEYNLVHRRGIKPHGSRKCSNCN